MEPSIWPKLCIYNHFRAISGADVDCSEGAGFTAWDRLNKDDCFCEVTPGRDPTNALAGVAIAFLGLHLGLFHDSKQGEVGITDRLASGLEE